MSLQLVSPISRPLIVIVVSRALLLFLASESLPFSTAWRMGKSTYSGRCDRARRPCSRRVRKRPPEGGLSKVAA
jgi:hypothetical protein